jgi:hypothetical protein
VPNTKRAAAGAGFCLIWHVRGLSTPLQETCYFFAACTRRK